ncbi:MAG TPA: hypothetical protein PK760_05415 [Flavobacteriales bacterium]|nr:hypothetical protein [Flavobacteriales bacterium]
MDLTHIKKYEHQHCRFKLRNGKDVYGVVWEVETSDAAGSSTGKRLYFASVSDYERLQRSASPVHVMPMQPEEIVAVESLAS